MLDYIYKYMIVKINGNVDCVMLCFPIEKKNKQFQKIIKLNKIKLNGYFPKETGRT